MPGTQKELAADFDLVGGYSIIEEFVGKEVRVFLVTGNTLSGVLVRALGKFIFVRGDRQQECIVNLDHTTSVTKK